MFGPCFSGIFYLFKKGQKVFSSNKIFDLGVNNKGQKSRFFEIGCKNKI